MLIFICSAAWLGSIVVNGANGMRAWAISAAALAQGHFETLFLHMFAHAGAVHLFFNMAVLWQIGPTLTARLGGFPINCIRFLALFIGSGLAGAALFLALHPTGTTPMLGASGAIFGVVGLYIRTSPQVGVIRSITSSRIETIATALILQNVMLMVYLASLTWTIGAGIGLAWEAHLGGFLFGLLVGPRFTPSPAHAPGLEPVAHATPAAAATSAD